MAMLIVTCTREGVNENYIATFNGVVDLYAPSKGLPSYAVTSHDYWGEFDDFRTALDKVEELVSALVYPPHLKRGDTLHTNRRDHSNVLSIHTCQQSQAPS